MIKEFGQSVASIELSACSYVSLSESASSTCAKDDTTSTVSMSGLIGMSALRVTGDLDRDRDPR